MKYLSDNVMNEGRRYWSAMRDESVWWGRGAAVEQCLYAKARVYNTIILFD